MDDQTGPAPSIEELLEFAKSRELEPSSKGRLDDECRYFVAWLDGREPSPELGGAYLTSQASELSTATIKARRWALDSIFGWNQMPCSCGRCIWNDAQDRAVAQSIPKQMTRRLTDDEVKAVLKAIDIYRPTSVEWDVKGARDACIISLIRSGDFRRRTIIDIDRSDVELVPIGVRVGDAIVKRNHAVPTLDPVHRMAEWCRIVDSGPLFRKVEGNGNVSDRRLHPSSITTIVRSAFDLAGLGIDPRRISAESFRPPR